MTTAYPLSVDGLVLHCAFRYALGRMTYMPDHVARCIRANLPQIDKGTLNCFVREIERAGEQSALGMECDERTWSQLASDIRDHLAARDSALASGGGQ